MPKLRCTAIILDLSINGSKPEVVHFDYLGHWFEAMEEIVDHYSITRRGGATVDAERIVLVSFSAMNMEITP